MTSPTLNAMVSEIEDIAHQLRHDAIERHVAARHLDEIAKSLARITRHGES